MVYWQNRMYTAIHSYYSALYNDLDNWIPSYEYGHQKQILALKVHPQGRYFGTAGHDYRWLNRRAREWGRVVYLWDTLKQSSYVQLVTTHQMPITEFRFSSDGMYVFVASSDGLLSQWNFCFPGNIQHFRGHGSRVNSLQLEPSNRLLCSGSADGTTRIWDVRTGRHTHTFLSEACNPVTSVTFDSSGYRVISASKHRLDFWDLRAVAMVAQLDEHKGLITGTSLSPDGSFLLSNSQDDTLRVWDIRTYSPSGGTCLNVFRGHLHDPTSKNQLLRCAWSADNFYVSAGSSDGVLCVWNRKWQTPVAMMSAHQQAITDVDFHPGANLLLSGSIDRRIFWQVVNPNR